jgi:type VI secretion system protein ImpA
MIDYPSVATAVSDAQPCGPDLESEGDDEFLNYVTGAEGRLPASFFTFSKEDLDLNREVGAISALLQRTRDIRLLVLAAKFSILADDFLQFVGAVEAIAVLLAQRWADVHPRPLDGDFWHRRVHIESLDDMPTVCLPLQYASLVTHRRHGRISLRSSLIAHGEVQAREGDTVLDKATVLDALVSIDDLLELTGKYQAACRLEKAVSAISECYTQGTQYTEVLSFERLPVLAQKIRELLEEALTQRDPSAVQKSEADVAAHAGANKAGGPDGDEAGRTGATAPHSAHPTPPRLESLAAAVAALQAAERYFATLEPSNPCILLIGQARQLIGKSFFEAMQLLVPDRLESARVRLGGQNGLAIPISQLAAVAAGGEARAPCPAQSPDGDAEDYHAATRDEAVSLIEAAERYILQFEPSSPVPLLLGRARSYVNRDFSSLLDELAPPAKE